MALDALFTTIGIILYRLHKNVAIGDGNRKVTAVGFSQVPTKVLGNSTLVILPKILNLLHYLILHLEQLIQQRFVIIDVELNNNTAVLVF